jgi:pimeloyl-ACP methyl ester carboxylesterase
MPLAPAPAEPPPIPGVRRSFVHARGVRFHVTEAGEGLPVVVLHGWPQHHYAYRHLLRNPPLGLRIIAPDLPGYGWSGPAPHRWAKEDVASDVLALFDALGLERVVLVGHDWGGFVGYLMVLREPARFHAYLALNMAHPWQTPRTTLPHVWRLLAYQPAMAIAGVWLHQRTRLIERGITAGVTNRSAMPREDTRWFSDRFRDPVCARAARDTYRTFWLREIPTSGLRPERRRSTVPIRALFGTDDVAIHKSLVDERTALADDYRVELISGSGHFIAEERPELVRARLVSLADPHR